MEAAPGRMPTRAPAGPHEASDAVPLQQEPVPNTAPSRAEPDATPAPAAAMPEDAHASPADAPVAPAAAAPAPQVAPPVVPAPDAPAADVPVPPTADAATPPAASAPADNVVRSDDTLRASDVIALRGVSRDYGDGVGVFDIDLQVPGGTILGIVGPSGAGKTTTIRLITGALEPTSGEVTVLGENPTRFRRHTRERIGYMPQQFALYPDLTADENVDFVASLFGLLVRRRRRRVREVLELVGLWDARGRRAGKLSGGMQRRLELACALVHEPDLLLLDEPTAGIDPILRKVIWEELTRLREAGRTLLVTTQYVTEAEQCDAVALIAGGRLVALGTPDELRRRASGGDLIEIETAAAFDPEPLTGRNGIRRVRSTGSRTFIAVTDDAGTTTPLMDDLVSESGGKVVAARQIHLTFDEVFTTLVEHDRAAREGMLAQEGGGEDRGSRDGDGPVDPRSMDAPGDDVAGAA